MTTPDPNFLHGQLLATQAMVLALACITTDREAWRVETFRRLEQLHGALLPLPVPEAQIAAVLAAQEWVSACTAADQVAAPCAG